MGEERQTLSRAEAEEGGAVELGGSRERWRSG